MHEMATSSAPTTESSSGIAAAFSATSGIMHRPQGLPQTLMKLLIDESVPEAIWWLPGGKEFAINSEKFPSMVLEVYFPDCKYASFIRRVHKMGFSRETRTLKKVYGAEIPPHAVAFRHPKFLKENPELAREIKQGPGKASKAKQARDKPSPASSRSASPPNAPAARANLSFALAGNGLVASPVSLPHEEMLQRLSRASAYSVASGHQSFEEEKESAMRTYEIRVPEAVASPSVFGEASILSYIETLQRRREQEGQLQRRMDELRQERQLRALLEEHQARQQATLRQQLLAAALMNTNANTNSSTSTGANTYQAGLQQLLSNSRSPLSLLNDASASSSSPGQRNEDVSASLELLLRLRQGTDAPGHTSTTFTD